MAAIDRAMNLPVAKLEHLCAVQIATRRFCRAINFSEGAVFEAIIGVSELAHHLLLEQSQSGEVRLKAVKVKDGYALEARVTRADGKFKSPTAANSAVFSHGHSALVEHQ